jgi:hypothetical protein
MLDTRSADEATPNATEATGRTERAGPHPGIDRFARDSPLEGDGFEQSVPRRPTLPFEIALLRIKASAISRLVAIVALQRSSKG